MAEKKQDVAAEPAHSIQIGTIEFSAERDKIAPALLAVQKALGTVAHDATGEVKKDGRTVYSYQYTSLPGLLAAVKPHLIANDLFLMFGGEDMNPSRVTAAVMHESGQWAQTTPSMPTGAMPQGVGSGLSYGKRYAALLLFALATEDDDGRAAQASVEKSQRPQRPEVTNDTLNELPANIAEGLSILDYTRGKAKALVDKHMDDTGAVDHNALLAEVNRLVDAGAKR